MFPQTVGLGEFCFRESYYYAKTKDICVRISMKCILRRTRVPKREYVGEIQEEILEQGRYIITIEAKIER